MSAVAANPDTARRVLVVTPERDTVRMVRSCAVVEWPDVEFTHYDPRQTGRPPDPDELTSHGVVMLSVELGLDDVTGIDWLVDLRASFGTGSIIVITSTSDSSVAVRAIKLGADDYLPNEELSAQRLGQTLGDAFRTGSTSSAASMTLHPHDTRSDGSETAPGAGVEEMPVATPVHSGSPREHVREDVNPEDSGVLHLPGRAALRIPGYRVRGMLGAGAMAKVFVADRLRDGQRVAFKVLDVNDDGDPAILQRFMREYKLLREVRHRHVIRLFTRVLAPDYVCLVMEYCEGGDLGKRIAEGMSPDRALRHLRDIASGLAAGHEHGVVHRDVKPGNILFRADGSLAVADFGAAAQLGEDRLTQTGAIVGTPFYLSPEQLRGAPATAQSDLYSLGVVFHEMLTGRKPYAPPRLSELIDQHLRAPPPTLTGDAARMQPMLDRLMAKDPDDRPQGAAAVAAAIR